MTAKRSVLLLCSLLLCAAVACLGATSDADNSAAASAYEIVAHPTLAFTPSSAEFSSAAQRSPSTASLCSLPAAPLLLTALSAVSVSTVSGLCRGHTLPGSERYCLAPNGAADVAVTAQLHRAETGTWPTLEQLATLSLQLLLDDSHPLRLGSLRLVPQLPADSTPSPSEHRMSVPFRGVLSAGTERVGLFDLLFEPAPSAHWLSLGSINASVAVEVGGSAAAQPARQRTPLCAHSVACVRSCATVRVLQVTCSDGVFCNGSDGAGGVG